MTNDDALARGDNTKLVIAMGFGAILILMFILVFVALTQLQSLNRSMSALVEETNAKSEAAHTMRDAIRLRANTLKAMQLSDDRFERDEAFLRLVAYSGVYREAREQLVAKANSEAEQDIHFRLSEATRVAQPLNEHAADLLHSGIQDENVVQVMEDAEAAQEVLLDLLDELVALSRHSAQEAVSGSILHYRETRNVMFLLAVVVLVLGMTIATLVIRQAAEKNRKITYQARHDALTGLVNRCELERQLQNAISTAQLDNAEHALMYIDLDQFKVVNDTCGHMAGDNLLVAITALLSDGTRKSDTVGRLGGDEFAVLLKHCPASRAVVIGEALRERVETFRFPWEGKTFSVSASIGIVPIIKGDATLAKILSTADMACYMAKQGGRNRVHAATPDDQDIVSQRWESERLGLIKQALEKGRFELHGQSIVPIGMGSSDSGHIEILVRMLGDDGGLIQPGAFIPTAERFNLMPAIDRFVVGHAVEWLVGECHGETAPTIMINLSGQSLSDDHFLTFVLNELGKKDVPAEKICFEITETAALANIGTAKEFIVRVKSLGCQFALDDFGSGFSSFAYLKSLPVDYLKIDGSFVKDIADDPIDYAMVKAINEIGHVLNKKTIAEFVENESILEKLGLLGVDYAQGYGISKPQPLSAHEPTRNPRQIDSAVRAADAPVLAGTIRSSS